MRTTIIANAVKVVFNCLLINGNLGFPGMGVKGAAIATLLGNIIACTVSIASLLKKNQFLKFKLADCLKIHPQNFKMLAIIGGGAGTEQVCLRIGFLCFC